VFIQWHNDASYNNGANNNNSDSTGVWIVIISLCILCFAFRHMNDFYAGQTVKII
jgi:hypothetical protein